MSEPAPDEPEQIVLMQRMVDMAAERTRMAAERNEMSAERSYLNAERTLSVWIRTALALMVFGIAVDRLGLFLTQLGGHAGAPSHGWSSATGAGLVAFGVVMAALTGARFVAYSVSFRRTHTVPSYHGPFLAPAFAAVAAVFGAVLLVAMLTVLG